MADKWIADAGARSGHCDRLPRNIYGTNGDWETYSTPSRDARLKTAFKESRDNAQRFVGMYENGDTKHLLYSGSDLVGNMLAAYIVSTGNYVNTTASLRASVR